MAERATAVMNAMAEVARVVAGGGSSGGRSGGGGAGGADGGDGSGGVGGGEGGVWDAGREGAGCHGGAVLQSQAPAHEGPMGPFKTPLQNKPTRDSNSQPSGLIIRLNHSATYSKRFLSQLLHF